MGTYSRFSLMIALVLATCTSSLGAAQALADGPGDLSLGVHSVLEARIDESHPDILVIFRCEFSQENMACVPIARRNLAQWRKRIRSQRRIAYEVAGGDVLGVSALAVGAGAGAAVVTGAAMMGSAFSVPVGAVSASLVGALGVASVNLINETNPEFHFDRAALASNLIKSAAARGGPDLTIDDTAYNDEILRADLSATSPAQ